MPALGWIQSLLVPTVAAVVLVAIAYGLGRFSLRPLQLPHDVDPLASLAVGLGLLCSTVYALGALHLLGRGTLRLLVLAGAVAAVAGLLTRPRAARSPIRLRALDLLLGAILFLFGFVYASLPPYFYDALVYHLALPARYLASGSIAPPPDLGLAGYPQNGEVLSALAMALGGETAAQIFNYLVAWGGVCGLWWFLASRTSRVAASVGALIVVAPWPFWFISTCCKDDLLGAVFLLGSFVLLVGGPLRLRTALVAGCLAGFGIGTKYPNVLSAGALLLVVPFVAPGRRARMAAVFALGLACAAAPWPARNALTFGNPVYPLFGQQLGSPRLTAHGAQLMSEETGQSMDRSPLAIVKRLAALGVDEEAFGWGSKISPILLPTMLLGALATRRRELRIGLTLGAAILIVALSLLTAYVRTFAFAWMLGALAPAALLERARTRTMQALVVAMFGLAIVGALATVPVQFEQYSAHGSRVFFGHETPAAFAERHSNYLPLALGPVRALPASSRLMVVGSTRAAFLPRPAEWSYVWDEPPIKTLFVGGATPDQAITTLRGRGITHLLVNGPEMLRNENRYKWLGLDEPGMRDWLADVVRRLSLVAKANDCYLYSLPTAP